MLRAALSLLLLTACRPPSATAPADAGEAAPEARPAAPPIDRDREVTLASDDACPDVAENRNGIADGDGCPDELPEDLARITGVIPELRFSINKDSIVAGREALSAIAEVLQRYPEVVVEIQGHIAATKEKHYRVDLSSRRAQSTRRFLIAAGVDPERLIAVGYGEERPIADNKTAAGRVQNSRVELAIVSR
ncbi:MAG: OmpA family protein [Nannocystaceae bacterium]